MEDVSTYILELLENIGTPKNQARHFDSMIGNQADWATAMNTLTHNELSQNLPRVWPPAKSMDNLQLWRLTHAAIQKLLADGLIKPIKLEHGAVRYRRMNILERLAHIGVDDEEE